jgi:hypothetical protein
MDIAPRMLGPRGALTPLIVAMIIDDGGFGCIFIDGIENARLWVFRGHQTQIPKSSPRPPKSSGIFIVGGAGL